MMGTPLKQAVGLLIEVLGEIVEEYEDLKNVRSGWAQRLLDIVKMLQVASSEKSTVLYTHMHRRPRRVSGKI